MSDELVARIVLFIVMGATGVLLLWMSRAAANGRLRRNQIAGIRTPSTMTSEEAWLAAHQRAEVPMRLAAVASFLMALSAAVPWSEDMVFASVIVGSAVVLGLAIYSAVVGGRAGREAETARGDER